MKTYIKTLLIAIVTLCTTSCLEAGLDDLPEFEENSIVGVQRVEYRFVSDEISNASGQNIVKFVELSKTADIDDENSHIKLTIKVPVASVSFPEKARQECSLNNISVMVSLSTAARILPFQGAPKLGVPGDWSNLNKYEVMAANGQKRIWTIEVVEFVK